MDITIDARPVVEDERSSEAGPVGNRRSGDQDDDGKVDSPSAGVRDVSAFGGAGWLLRWLVFGPAGLWAHEQIVQFRGGVVTLALSAPLMFPGDSGDNGDNGAEECYNLCKT